MLISTAWPELALVPLLFLLFSSPCLSTPRSDADDMFHFLGATKHLYIRVGLLVRWTVGPLVRRSVKPSQFWRAKMEVISLLGIFRCILTSL